MTNRSMKMTEAMITMWIRENERNDSLKANAFYGKPLPVHLGNQAGFESLNRAFTTVAVTHYQYGPAPVQDNESISFF